MDPQVKKSLELLGLNTSDFENCEEFALLEKVLSSIDAENILTPEEVECLEYAEVVGLEDEDVVKKLQENGIDEDVLDINESTIEYLQKKLRSLESYVWDSTIDILRQQHIKLVKTLRELQQKLDSVNLKGHVKLGEEKWRQNWSELQLLYQELNSINSREEYVVDKGFPFSEKNVDEFVEIVLQNVKRVWNRTSTNGNGDSQENKETSQTTTNDCNAESEMLMQLEIIEPGLTCAHYNSLQAKGNEENMGYTGMLLKIVQFQPQDQGNANNEDIDLEKLETYYSNIIDFSEKQTKMKGILHNLEFIKAHRETCIAAFKECIDVLEKQQVLLDLVYIVRILWDQPHDAVQQTLIHCYEYFHHEVTNMKARIACLEEHKRKFESYLEEENTYPQMLEKFSKKYFPTEKQCLKNLIEDYEKKLQLTINEKKESLLDSKIQLAEIEKDIARIQEDLNFSMQKLSQLSIGFTASLDTLQARKDERDGLNTSISLSPTQQKRRLLWVYFLTDIKKIQDLKDEIDAIPENTAPSTPSFMNKFPCFTSTPKGED